MDNNWRIVETNNHQESYKIKMGYSGKPNVNPTKSDVGNPRIMNIKGIIWVDMGNAINGKMWIIW